MRSRPILWFVISLLCLVGAYYFWQWGEQRAGRGAPASPASTNESARSPHAQFQPASPAHSPVVPVPQIQPPGVTNATPEELAAAKRAERLKYRLANTTSKIGELVHNDRAVLLENALIDTAQSVALSIPEHLRSHGDPGSYIVQSCGPLDNAFRALLKEVGAEIVSYIPNNAYLVRMTASQAQQMAGGACAVLPFEPYYKLKSELLKLAVEQEPLPEDSGLNVLLFDGENQAVIDTLQRRGVRIVARDRSPFGPVLKVIPPVDALVDIAGLNGVQGLELLRRRVPANDMTRVIMSVASDSVTLTNYLGLDGTGVKVNINDGGVDATHPDLSPRVNGDALTDTDGHGTHVAGIIASSGLNDGDPSGPVVSTNASGSVTNADFRGKAPAAKILSLGVDFGTLFVSDSYLQETAANDPENIFISNNSWGVNGENGYDLTAASYDAAVRDALPSVTGSRPLAYVFSAGNEGIARDEDNGQGGQPDTVSAPATAKNVIAVGATELGRFITNQFGLNGVTNQYFYFATDGTNQVASFSSRGNAGIGIEGEFGRFKPDVVAPGTFVVSTRSQQWNQNAYYNPSNTFFAVVLNITVDPGSRFDDFFFVPDNAVQMQITLTNLTSPPPLPTLPIYAKAGSVPGLGDFRGNNQITVTFPPDQNNNFWYYTVRNPWQVAVSFDVLLQIVVTNDNGALETIHQMNDKLGTLYRYESGTSMAAPAVSGMMALMQQFMEAHGGRPSPALMKAMVINGARSMEGYNFQVQNTINYQGWGLVNLTNSIPRVLADSGAYPAYTSHNPGPMQIFDQSADEALITGQTRTRTISLNNSARNQPLRISLVWTDPPGNPAAGVKLVNDLDLVVTNLVNGRVYYGNDIEAGFVSNTARDTNSFPNLDAINNVENVYIPNTLSSNYSITVIGRRVNVNAVTTNDNVAQDYALVISSGNGRTNNQITVVQDTPPPVFAETPLSTIVTNGFRDMPGVVGNTLFGQHVGASTPQLGLDTVGLPGYSTNAAMTVGQTNQWHFYIFTNNLVLGVTNANFPTNYVAFVTFLPYTLSIPREGVFETTVQNATREEADIDLYVSTNAAFTNLVPIEIATATKSLSRGGTEVITFTNDNGPGQVYYVGVKSEDRQAAEYGFLAIASDVPFSTEDQQGVTIRGVPVPSIIPDGTPKKPGAALIFGIAVSPEKTRRVLVTNDISHQLFGDLLGNLSHDRKFAVLNNHTGGNGTTNQFLIYEDNGEDVPFIPNPYILKTSDGPGNLRNFVGEPIAGLWLFTVVDNAQFQVGTVEQTMIRVEKQLDYGGGAGVTLVPGQLFFDSVDVPPDATNLTIRIEGNTQPIQLFIRRDTFPVIIPNASITDDIADYATIIPASPIPPRKLAIDKTSNPPLNAGRYYFGIFNPPANVQQNITVFVEVLTDANGVQPLRPTSTGFEQLLDDAVTNSTIVVTNDRRIATVDVGLCIDHPRISDLAITLVSPKGTRVLLMENRGGLTTEGAGSSAINTNVVPKSSAGGPVADTNIFNAGVNQGTLIVDYNFESIPDRMTVYYDGALIHDTGLVNGTNRFVLNFGPGLGTDLELVMNEGNNSNTGTVWSYTATVITSAFEYLNFTENTNLTITPIKFAVPPFVGPSAGTNVTQVWHSTFGPPLPTGVVGGSFGEGWRLDAGDIEVGEQGGAPAYEVPNYLDINGGVNGTVSVNITNVTVGKTYRLSFVYARNPVGIGGPVPTVEVLVNSNLVYTVIGNQTNSFANLDWQTVSLPVTAIASPMHLRLRSLVPGSSGGVYFDAFNLEEILLTPTGLYYLPEESLDVLKGENAQGEWHLELWDNRVGAPIPADALQSWQLSFVFQNLIPQPPTFTNIICGIGITNISINVPTNAAFASNILVSATGPLYVYFNQTGPVPPGTEMLAGVTNGTFLLTTNTVPPLVPGTNYYIGILNTNPGCVTFVYQVRFGTDAPPVSIELTNTVPYCATLPGTGDTNAYYLFTVSTNSRRAQFEINGPTGDMTLVVRKGLPADLTSFDYISTNSFTNDELIVVYDFSNPVPLSPGNWYFTAVNVSGAPVSYCVKATEWPDTGTDLRIIRWEFITNSFCVTWNSLIGAHYVVQGNTNLNIPIWDDVSPTITAVNTQTTWCITLPSPYHFFRVREGLALSTNLPPPVTATPLVSATSYCSTNSGTGNTNDSYLFTVSGGSVRAQFEINGPTGDMALVVKKGLPLPNLTTFDYISTNSYTNDELIVIFDYSSPVALSPGDWYLTAVNLSGGPVSYCIKATEWPVYGTNFAIIQWQFVANSFCLTWNSLIGARYVVEGNTNLSIPIWDDVSPTIPAVSAQTTWCVPLPSPYNFFRVREGLALSTNVVPAVPPVGPAFSSVTLTNGNILLQWSGPTNQEYLVEWATNLPPVAWNVVPTTIYSTNGQFSFIDDGSQTILPLGPVRFYRLRLYP